MDDAAGCDFRFVVNGKTHHIEVKSSSGADEMFTLGSSEIRLAMQLSKSKRSRRKGLFLLVRVLNALSERPVFQLLPILTDERFRSLYDIVEAGARVRYRVNVPPIVPFALTGKAVCPHRRPARSAGRPFSFGQRRATARLTSPASPERWVFGSTNIPTCLPRVLGPEGIFC